VQKLLFSGRRVEDSSKSNNNNVLEKRRVVRDQSGQASQPLVRIARDHAFLIWKKKKTKELGKSGGDEIGEKRGSNRTGPTNPGIRKARDQSEPRGEEGTNGKAVNEKFLYPFSVGGKKREGQRSPAYTERGESGDSKAAAASDSNLGEGGVGRTYQPKRGRNIRTGS